MADTFRAVLWQPLFCRTLSAHFPADTFRILVGGPLSDGGHFLAHTSRALSAHFFGGHFPHTFLVGTFRTLFRRTVSAHFFWRALFTGHFPHTFLMDTFLAATFSVGAFLADTFRKLSAQFFGGHFFAGHFFRALSAHFLRSFRTHFSPHTFLTGISRAVFLAATFYRTLPGGHFSHIFVADFSNGPFPAHTFLPGISWWTLSAHFFVGRFLRAATFRALVFFLADTFWADTLCALF